MPHQTVAIIDMGTNTFHILVAQIKEDRSYQIVYRQRIVVMIGKGGINQGMITEAAQQRALGALQEFVAVIDRFQAQHVRATATSAFRNARNGAVLAARIHDETGIHVEVIGGLQEAEYIFRGVQEALTLGDESVLIMDIGGGSVEFVISSNQQIRWKQSFEIGAQRLLDRFDIQDPISEKNQAVLRTYFQETLSPLLIASDTWQPHTLVGASGTFDTLCAIHAHQKGIEIRLDDCELPVSSDRFASILQDIIGKTRDERLAIPGMAEMRVDMIVVAACLIQFVVGRLPLDRLRVSGYALKEGVLRTMIQELPST